ncbi:hypothetical protein HZA56_13590 [Candidatus Poribacteria bacterium]|nr:hypothetical protein [Candidatus Poribacteria bacterium]
MSPLRGLMVLASTLIILTASVNARAVDVGEQEIGITVDATYVTKYIWKGFDLLDDNGAWQPSITLSYSDFSLGVWGSWADTRGFTAQDELDYFLCYQPSLFEEKRCALDLSLTYTYFDFPHSDSVAGGDEIADGQELALGVSLPNAFPLGPSSLAPYYEGDFEWQGMHHDSSVDKGWIHTFGLAYDIPVSPLLKQQEEQAICLCWDITYNDGVFGTAAGWSHSTLGVSTTFECKGFAFTPVVNYQWSYEDTVNEENEFYASFSLSYYF